MIEQFRIRMVSYCQEKAVHSDIKNLAILPHQPRSCDTVFVTEDLLRIAVPEDLDIFRIPDPFLHSFRCPEDVTSYNHIDLPAKSGKIGSFLTCRIPAPYNSHGLLPVEETVTGSARRYTESPILDFRWKSEILGGSTCSDYKSLRIHLIFSVNDYPERSLGKVSLSDRTHTDIRTETHSLSLHRIHQLLTGDTVFKTGVILYICSSGELSSRLDTLIYDRGKICSGCIDSRCITGRTTSYDKTFYCFHM